MPLPRKLLIFLGAPLCAVAAAFDWWGLGTEGPWRRLLFSSKSAKESRSRSSSRSAAAAAAASGRGKEERDGERSAGSPSSSLSLSSSSSSFFYLFADSPRKSWIVPVQLLTSALLLAFGPQAARAVSAGDVPRATLFFFALVLLAATQDIAVDGWALTLLSRERVGWASTCQTVGTNLGFFASFTALLALGDPGFCARWVFRNSGERRPAAAARWGAGSEGPWGVVSALVARARSSPLAGRLASPFFPSSSSPSSSAAAAAAAASGGPVLWSLGGYLLFWGWAYLAVTLFVAVCVPEKKMEEDEEEEEQEEGGGGGGGGGRGGRGEGGGGRGGRGGARGGSERAEEEGGGADGPKPASSSSSSSLSEIALAYRRLADVMRLPAVQRLCLLLLTCRLAILPAEAAAALALSETGVPRRALAGLVLLQLPAEAAAAFLAGRAAGGGGGGGGGPGSGGSGGGGSSGSGSGSGKRTGAAAAWVRGYWLRLAAALATTALVVSQPDSCPSSSSSSSSSSSCLTPARFAALALAGLLTAFSATLQFTCMGAVFSRVADPRFGGSDLTLLNSVANLGIPLPRGLVLLAVDALGLGAVSAAAVLLGACAGAAWYSRELPRLEALPTSAWRAGTVGGAGGGGGSKGKKKKTED